VSELECPGTVHNRPGLFVYTVGIINGDNSVNGERICYKEDKRDSSIVVVLLQSYISDRSNSRQDPFRTPLEERVGRAYSGQAVDCIRVAYTDTLLAETVKQLVK